MLFTCCLTKWIKVFWVFFFLTLKWYFVWMIVSFSFTCILCVCVCVLFKKNKLFNIFEKFSCKLPSWSVICRLQVNSTWRDGEHIYNFYDLHTLLNLKGIWLSCTDCSHLAWDFTGITQRDVWVTLLELYLHHDLIWDQQGTIWGVGAESQMLPPL